MPVIKPKSSVRTRKLPVKTIVISAAIIVVIGIVVAMFWGPITHFIDNPERIRQFVDDAGVFGPLVFIAIQFLQTLIAPIPGQVVGLAAGALFGTWLGALYSLIGSFLGMWAVIAIARRLGRPFIERFVKPETLDKFDYLTKNNGPIVFFLIMLLPVFPDDIICYLVGLSKIPIKALLLVGMLGRIPGTIGSTLIGDGVADVSIQLVVGVSLIFAVVFAVGYWQRLRLESWIKRLSSGPDNKQDK